MAFALVDKGDYSSPVLVVKVFIQKLVAAVGAPPAVDAVFRTPLYADANVHFVVV